MNLQNRLLRLMYSRAHDVLIASDVRGRIHKLSLDLQVLQSSPVVSYDRPVNALCLSADYVFTRDRFGAIGKWDMHTLQPLDFYDGKMIGDRARLMPNEEPSPTPNRAIACLRGRVYTPNGYNQIVVLDEETFEVLDVRESPSKTFVDCICVDHPEIHAMTDVDGAIWIGNIERNEFPVQRIIDTNVVHGVIYDERHDRFWTTQDGGLGSDRCVRTGVTTIRTDGSGFSEFKLSHEDNEFLAVEPEGRYVVTGGFNGKLSIFDNAERDFRLVRSIGPLEFQIIHAAVVSKDRIYALLQTGDIICVDFDGVERCRTHFHKNCVWTLEVHPREPGTFYAGTDHGIVQLTCCAGAYDSVQLKQVARHGQAFGIVKDVRPFPDGSMLGISRKGDVFKLSQQGAIQWQRQVLGVPRGIALGGEYDRCMISTDSGTVWELNTRNGEVLDQLPVGSASYGCVYLGDGRRAVTADAGTQVLVYAADSHAVRGAVQGFSHRLKRIGRLSNGEIFVTGPDGMFELDLVNYKVRKAFGDYLVSTKENGVLCQGHLYVGGYGYQVATYLYETGEIVDLQETLPDFTKAFAAFVPAAGAPVLLVGGRGGFINAYRLHRGVPVKVREYYLR